MLASIATEPPTDEEFERAINRIEMQHYRTLSRVGGFGGRADALNYFNTFTGDPDRLNRVMDDYRKVTREDVLRVHQQILSGGQVRMRVYPERPLSTASLTVDRSMQPDGGPTPAFAPPTPQRGRLGNGMEVIVANKPGLPLVSFALLARAGATGDPASLPGLSSFTAAMMDEGTANRSSQEISAAFEHIGSRLGAEARKGTHVVDGGDVGPALANTRWAWPPTWARNANFPETRNWSGCAGNG